MFSFCTPFVVHMKQGLKDTKASANRINNQLCIYAGEESHHFNTYLNEQNGNKPLLLLYYSDLHLPPSLFQEAERTAWQGRVIQLRQ